MGIVYILQFFWIFIFVVLIIATFIMTVFWNLCTSVQVQEYHQCIDLTQFCTYTQFILHTNFNILMPSCYKY